MSLQLCPGSVPDVRIAPTTALLGMVSQVTSDVHAVLLLCHSKTPQHVLAVPHPPFPGEGEMCGSGPIF